MASALRGPVTVAADEERVHAVRRKDSVTRQERVDRRGCEVENVGPHGRALRSEEQSVRHRQPERDEARVVQAAPRTALDVPTHVEAGNEASRGV